MSESLLHGRSFGLLVYGVVHHSYTISAWRYMELYGLSYARETNENTAHWLLWNFMELHGETKNRHQAPIPSFIYDHISLNLYISK